MIITKLELKNFRQYYDLVSFEFPHEDGKNISVIHAENGVGKTALLNAVKWVFHGKFTGGFNTEKLINLAAESEGKKTCSVSVFFIHDDEEFEARRTYSLDNPAKKAGNLQLFRINEGTYNVVLEPSYIINTIIPSEMSDYYFFHGEESTAIQAKSDGYDLKKSIENVLGFEVADKTLTRLKNLLSQVNSEIAKHDKTAETEGLYRTIEENEKSLTSQKNKKDNLCNTINKLEGELRNIDNELSKISHADLTNLKNQERDVNSEIADVDKQLRDLYRDKAQSISQYGWVVFGQNFAGDTLDFIDDSVLSGRLPEPYNETFINDILSLSECICGTKLVENTPAFEKVKSLLQKASNPILAARVSQVRSHIHHIPTMFSHAKEKLTNISKSISSLDEKREHLMSKLRSIEKQIQEIPEQQIQRLQTSKHQIKKDLDEQKMLHGRTVEKIDRISSEISTKKMRYDSLVNVSDVASKYINKKEFLEKLITRLEEHLNKTRENVKLHIADSINKILSESTAQALSIRFSSSSGFNISVLNADRNEIALSTGQTLLLNLSVVSALFKFIRSGSLAKDPLLESATSAPLIVDAPFGVLDESYRKYVVEMLPEHAPQVIFLVTSSQWKPDMVENITNLIGSEYYLSAEQRGVQGDRPMRKYNIYGTEYFVDKYDRDRDRTKAVRIEK